jgi:diguanylate cyclase (GGDEF)-like protein/PAS domain S-box-containing protein
VAQTSQILEVLRDKLISNAEERWRTLTKHSLDQIMFLDPEGTILFYNRSHPMLESEADLLGQTLFDHLSEHDAELFNKAFEKVLASSQPDQIEIHHRNRDAEESVFETRIYPVIENDKVIAVITDTRNITKQYMQQDSLERSHALLHTVIDNLPVIIWAIDDKGIITLSVGKGLEALGYEDGQVVGESIFDVYKNHPDIIDDAEKALNGEAVQATVRIRQHTYQVTYNPVLNNSGEVSSVIGVANDITRLEQVETQLQIISAALETSTDVVMITRADGTVEYVNPAFEATTGYSQNEVIGHNPRLLKSGKQDQTFYQGMWDTLLKGENFSDVFINIRKDGSTYYEEKTITPVRTHNREITHFISTGKDISDRMRTQERLDYMAHHDALTKLPNRTLFLDRLRQAMARAHWHNRVIAVIFMNLDNFKNINDSYGEDVGDTLLVQLTQRLSSSVRIGDTIARFGGDEFAILLDDVAAEKDVSQLAKKILDTFAKPFSIRQHEILLTASVGVSIFPSDGDDSETLLRNAGVAMYRAKHLGKNNYQFFSNEMSARAFERLTLENSLRHALKRGEFYLDYQPQIDSRTQKVTAVEALLRWQHPDYGVVSPTDFVPILEESGLIVTVGDWVLRTACEQAVEWHQQGYESLRMCVNLSSRQFNNPDFIQSFHSIISETGIEPERLELELTETLLMRNASKTVSALNTLSHVGVQIAVDDFGTGYSSLNYLRRFPIATLKIDRSFVQDVIEDSDDAAIATAIIVMAQSLNLNVVAEGVETEEQLEFLTSRHCYEIQGNFYSGPLNVSGVSSLLAKTSKK